MVATKAEPFLAKKCRPCEGGLARHTRSKAEAELKWIPGWQLSPDGLRIQRHWVVKDFMAAIDFFDRVAHLAEKEGHHPDLHLNGYRHVTIELSTHAIGGLSDNDFIMAAKINELPIELKIPAL